MTTLKKALRGLASLVKRWPVRAQALIVASIAVGTAFGLGWNGAQVGAVSAFTAALLAFLTEQAVTPVAEPTLPQGTEVIVTTPPGQPDRTTTV